MASKTGAKSNANRVTGKKLSDAERHKRFVDMAKEVGASDKPEDFDKAFRAVTKHAGKK